MSRCEAAAATHAFLRSCFALAPRILERAITSVFHVFGEDSMLDLRPSLSCYGKLFCSP